MKRPPAIELPGAATAAVARDRRFLVFVAAVLVALGMGLKSEVLGPTQVWAVAAALVIIAFVALIGYLAGAGGIPSVENFVAVGIGAIALAGLSTLVADVWRFAVLVLLFGIGFVVTGQLDYHRLRRQEKPGHLVLQTAALLFAISGAYLVVLAIQLELPARLLGIFLISGLAAYRDFRILGFAMNRGQSLFFALVLAQVVTLLASLINIFVAQVGEGVFAVMLVLAWYINRGLIRHAVEQSFTLQVVLEYTGLVVFLGYLFFFFSGFQPR
jgi:hypothetical protein